MRCRYSLHTKIEHQVEVFHPVTIAANIVVSSEHKVFIGDDVIVGNGAIIVGRHNQRLTIGNGAIIRVDAVVTKDLLLA